MTNFFIGHLSRHNFPMDCTIFDGRAGLETIQSKKTAWIGRFKQNGDLDGNLVSEVMPGQRVTYYVFGFACVADR